MTPLGFIGLGAMGELRALTTPHLADACLRAGAAVRCAPAALRPVAPGMRCAGRARPARHVGSVDVFFEALGSAASGDVLVADNGGRLDEACIGDLVALEVKNAGLAGMIVWGLHRDTDELIGIGLPIFSLGAIPVGPQRVDPRSPDAFSWARVGPFVVTGSDLVVADADGVIFLPEDRLPAIVTAAESIRATEREQAEKMRSGTSFRQQARFDEFLAQRAAHPGLGFREHLRRLGRAIEE
ncbi:MAG TPA: RraA family protein [Myxococcales bacterium]|nr:RraA family protein [Myxococcales bacterium]